MVLGRSVEPQGIGFPLLIAPAYALGGANAVEAFLAAIAALGFVLAAAVGRRMVPEPWASGAALLVGLSPLALAHATTVYPEAVAGTALAGAALCALRVRERPALGSALVGATLLAVLPWLGPKYLLPAAPIAIVLVRWTARRGRRTAALAAAEVMVASIVVYATINDRLFGGLTPYAASASGASPTGADSLAEHLERLPRLAALWIDRDVGLLRWAPVLALSVFAAWLLWRSRRAHVARLVEERADIEAAAELALWVWGARAARRGLRRARDRGRVVRGPPARRRAPDGGRAVRLGHAPRAAHRRRPRRPHARRLALARARLRVRGRGRLGRPRHQRAAGAGGRPAPAVGGRVGVVRRDRGRAVGGGGRCGGAGSGGGERELAGR